MKSKIKYYVISTISSIISMTIMRLGGCNTIVAIFMGSICGTGIANMIDELVRISKQ